MNLEEIRNFMLEHPGGVRLRMVDGTEYVIPHLDYVSFGPRDRPEAKRGPYATSFIVYDLKEQLRMRLVNALLVTEVEPLWQNGHGRGKGGRGQKSKR